MEVSSKLCPESLLFSLNWAIRELRISELFATLFHPCSIPGIILLLGIGVWWYELAQQQFEHHTRNTSKPLLSLALPLREVELLPLFYRQGSHTHEAQRSAVIFPVSPADRLWHSLHANSRGMLQNSFSALLEGILEGKSSRIFLSSRKVESTNFPGWTLCLSASNFLKNIKAPREM